MHHGLSSEITHRIWKAFDGRNSSSFHTIDVHHSKFHLSWNQMAFEFYRSSYVRKAVDYDRRTRIQEAIEEHERQVKSEKNPDNDFVLDNDIFLIDTLGDVD